MQGKGSGRGGRCGTNRRYSGTILRYRNAMSLRDNGSAAKQQEVVQLTAELQVLSFVGDTRY
eukprot:1837912-Rhodomonas_salina.1